MHNTQASFQENYKKAKALHDRHKFAESNKIIEPFIGAPCNDKKGWGDLMALAGNNNYHLGHYQQCLQHFTEAEKIFKELTLMKELSEAESNLGAIYKRLGLHGHALFKNLEAITYSFQANEEYVMTTSLMNSAMSLFEIGFTEKAFRALDTALLVCDKHAGDVKYEEMRLVVYNNKSTICFALKRFDEMLALLQESKKIAEKYSFKSTFNFIDSNISYCLSQLNRNEEAFSILQTVIKRRKNVHDDHYVADLTKMALLYKEHLHDDDKFLEYTSKALKLAESKNLISRQIMINRLLKKHYAGQNNTSELRRVDTRLNALETLDNQYKQTGGIEKLFDTNMLAVENNLREREQKHEFLERYDYLTGTYTYTHRGVTVPVLLSEIAFCEIVGNYLHIHIRFKNKSGQILVEDRHRVRTTMKDFIAQIHTSEIFFARIHNSFIINLNCLARESVKSGESIVVGNRELKISDSYRRPFKEKLNAFLENELVLP